MIRASDICKSYHEKRVLGPITLSFDAGKMVALVGGNGAGKSTLLRILGGAIAPSSGETLVSGLSRPLGSIRKARAAGIWMADQEGSLIPAWSVEEHFHRLAGIGSGEPWRRLVSTVQGMEMVRDLPQVERQLIEVALVCTGGVTAALFDEPTAGQGLHEKRLILDAMRGAASSGATVVWATHDLDAALSFSDRVVALKSGTVVLDDDPAHMTKTDLLAAFPGANGPLAEPRPAASTGATRLRICFDRDSDESINVNAGEIIGLVSNSTSKAREVLRATAGLASQSHFFIELVDQSDRRRLAYMSRERDLDWDFAGKSLRFNLTAGVINQLCSTGIIDKRREISVANELKQKFSIEAASLDSDIDELSGGNRQKTLLARLTSTKPRVLLLDEPFSGVDAPTRAALRSELRRLAGEGAAVAIYSQEWDDLIQAVDRIVVVRDDYELASFSSRSISAALIESVLNNISPSKLVPESQ